MPTFTLPEKVTVAASKGTKSACYRYAASELARLLGRLDVNVEQAQTTTPRGRFVLSVLAKQSKRQPGRPAVHGLKHDGFVLAITPGRVDIHAPSAKGVLNGVYELAERMGFTFLLPTEEWEWPPADGRKSVRLACRQVRMDPRFSYRGVYGLSSDDFTVDEWLRFFAKIRFNAMGATGPEHQKVADELGIRLETG